MPTYRFTVRINSDYIFEIQGQNQKDAEKELFDRIDKNIFGYTKAIVIDEQITNVEELKERWFCCVYEDKGIKYREYRLFPSFDAASTFMLAFKNNVISICEEDSDFTRSLDRNKEHVFQCE